MTTLTNHTQRIEAEVKRAHNSCWKKGHNLDEIDRALRPCRLHESNPGTSLDAEPSAEKHNELMAALQAAAHERRAIAWSTKQDHINAWLLQNLEASPDLTQLHRPFCKEGNEMHEEDWARSVLKFRHLDKAAKRGEQRDCSTNGAVDRKGSSYSYKK